MAEAHSFSMEGVQKQLDDHGWAVIPNVIPAETCDGYILEIDQWLQQFGPEGFPNNIHSIIHHYNIAHIAPAWAVRIKAKPVFASVWGTNKLHTSMDGIAVGRPPELGDTSFDDNAQGANALHLDQGPGKQGLHAYQGAVYLEEALEDDWTFMVMENSHLHHKNFFLAHKSGRSEFRKLNNTEINWYKDQGCTIKRMSMPKGSMVLWDSRTVHAGAPPIFGRKNVGRWRYVVFVSMTPAIWSNAKDLKEKQECYRSLRVSRHWSSQGFDMFRHKKKSQHNISEMPEIGQTEVARLLGGDIEYDFGDGESNGPTWKPKVA